MVSLFLGNVDEPGTTFISAGVVQHAIPHTSHVGLRVQSLAVKRHPSNLLIETFGPKV